MRWKVNDMRKIILFALLCLCVNMTGCSDDSIADKSEYDIREISGGQFKYCFYDFVDKDTGVHYIVYNNSGYYGGAGGITPRLNTDGTVMVTKE